MKCRQTILIEKRKRPPQLSNRSSRIRFRIFVKFLSCFGSEGLVVVLLALMVVMTCHG